MNSIFTIWNRLGVSRNSIVYLVDGSNLFFQFPNPDGVAKIQQARKDMTVPGPVIVVSNFVSYVHQIKPNIETVYKQLNTLTDATNPVVFAHVGMADCDGRNPDPMNCIVRDRDAGTCRYRTQGVLTSYSHELCEFDDVLLTRMFNVLTSKSYFCKIVSKDGRVHKEVDVIGDVSVELKRLGRAVRLGLEHEEGH